MKRRQAIRSAPLTENPVERRTELWPRVGKHGNQFRRNPAGARPTISEEKQCLFAAAEGLDLRFTSGDLEDVIDRAGMPKFGDGDDRGTTNRGYGAFQKTPRGVHSALNPRFGQRGVGG